jgi:hypothetical protein
MHIDVVVDGPTTFYAEMVVSRIGSGRIDYYRQRSHLGLTGNWNSCVRRARGLWIHLLHQDDLVRDQFYARLRGPCAADPNLAAAFSRGAGIDAGGKTLWVQEPERESAGILAHFVEREAATNRILSPSIVIRRAVYEQIGGFHNGMPYCADWDFYKRVVVYGPIWYEPQCLAAWRQHDGSTTARLKTSGADLADRRRTIELSERYLPAHVQEKAGNAALKSSVIWAAETLRESLMRDDFATGIAQTAEILQSLQQLTNTKGVSEVAAISESGKSSQDCLQLQARIDTLEAQLQAWMRAAEAIHAKYGKTSQ